MPLNDRQAVELFHLLFIRSLLTGSEKARCVIKGGCNMRFFFGSARYSEDIDFDVSQVATATLKKNVDKVLAGPMLGRSLAANDLAIANVSTPKQTETTQRWKIAIEQSKRSGSLHTKIEFSRRNGEGEAKLEAVSRNLLEHYRLPPILARHYLLPTALAQKVHALASRATVQARDVFDLSILLSRAGGEIPEPTNLDAEIEAAIDRALALSYSDFAGQVGAFLHPDERAALDSPEAWDAMRLQVVDGLERMRGNRANEEAGA